MRRIWAIGLTAIAMLLPIGVSRADGPTEEPVVTAESLGNAAAEARRFLAKYQSGPATFFVELSGQPLALVEAAAKKTAGDPEADLTDAQIAEVKANLQAEQAEVVRFVAANGGTVHGQLFWAINAVRVTLEGAHVPRVRELPGVKKLHELPYSRRSSASSVPAVGAPAVWGGDGKYTGKGIKVAVLDSGIDYTHATFGGEGTPEAFQAAAKTADPTPYFASTRVKGGTDLVGDAYDGTDATRRPDALTLSTAMTMVTARTSRLRSAAPASSPRERPTTALSTRRPIATSSRSHLAPRRRPSCMRCGSLVSPE